LARFFFETQCSINQLLYKPLAMNRQKLIPDPLGLRNPLDFVENQIQELQLGHHSTYQIWFGQWTGQRGLSGALGKHPK